MSTPGGVCGIAHGARIGVHSRAEHSERWMQHRKCAMACRERADMRHVITAKCTGCKNRHAYYKHIKRYLKKLEMAVPKSKHKAAMDTPMRLWVCECRVIIRQALSAIQKLRTDKRESDEEWEALRAIIAGVLPISKRVKEMREEHAQEGKRRKIEQRVAEVITAMQGEVMRMMEERWERTRQARAVEKREAEEDDEMVRLTAELERRETELRAQHERHEAARQERAEATARERGRRAAAREGQAVAMTRTMEERERDARDECAYECNRRTQRICVSCRIRIQTMCADCRIQHGLKQSAKMCTACRRETAGACAVCIERYEEVCGSCRTSGDVGRQRASHRNNDRERATEAGQRAVGVSRGKQSRRNEQERAGEAASNGKRRRVIRRRDEQATVEQLAEVGRWRRRKIGTTGKEAVDFKQVDENGEERWETRFYIQKSEIAGLGLFAAHDMAYDERIVVYNGEGSEDMGREGDETLLYGLEYQL